jgi:hypothetical protein
MIFLLVALFSSQALAYSDNQIQSMVSEKIAEIHPNQNPAQTASWWKGLGADASGVVIGMYNSDNNTYHRIRLIQGLGWRQDQEAIDFVENQAESTDTDVIRNAAVRAIGRGQGSGGIDFVSKFLKSPDPQTRLAAAETLHEMPDARAKDIFSSYLKDEKTAWLSDKLKGIPVGATGLHAVSSSEDRLSRDFEGTWKGYWLSAQANGRQAIGAKRSGIQTTPVILEFKTSADSNSVQGRLTILNRKALSRSFTILNASGKGVQVSGLLPGLGDFQSSLSRMSGQLVMEMRVPDQASVLILKKD